MTKRHKPVHLGAITEVSVDASGARIFLQEEAIVLMTTR